MRLRVQSYHNLDGRHLERAAASVPWYWRVVAVASAAMILGGFLMLPVTFDKDPQLRFSVTGLGIFAVVVLVAGFTTTALTCIMVRSLPYRVDAVLMPAFMSCTLGVLTVFYCFIVSGRYEINIFAILTLVVAAVGAIAYAVLLLLTNRKIAQSRRAVPGSVYLEQHPHPQPLTGSSTWQSPQYYQNYVRNMFPTASYEPHNIPNSTEPITEEELQRQQMLMLLLSQDSGTNADPSSNTFKIEWQGQDQEPNTPLNTHFGDRQSQFALSSQQRTSAKVQVPGQLRPWDGVWRGVARQSRAPDLTDPREARRREIEMGR